MIQSVRAHASVSRSLRIRRLMRLAATVVVILGVVGSRRTTSSAATLDACPTPRSAPAGPALWIPDQTLASGSAASITVSLAPGSTTIAGVQVDVGFPATAPIADKANGRPDCTVNPAIDKNGTSFLFRPSGCSGAACTAVRAVVLATDNIDAIPEDTALFTCRIDVGADVGSLLAYGLAGVILSDPRGGTVTDARNQDGLVCLYRAPAETCPTPRAAPSAPALWIPDQTAAASSAAGITVNLAAGGAEIAALQADVTFPVMAPIAAQANGKPDCTVNPAIDKNATSFFFWPDACSGATCTAVRVLVLATDNLDPIPDGAALVTCTVDVSGDSGTRLTYEIGRVILSDPSGQTVSDAGDQNGQICIGSGAPPPVCAGDCDGDRAVTVDEVVTLVRIALGTAPASNCPHGVPPDATIDITLVVQAVAHGLDNCPT
jgi:hypothetical protein